MTTYFQNIKTSSDFTNAKGDGVISIETVTISALSMDHLGITTNQFNNPGDVGKLILVPGAGPGGNALHTTIKSVDGPQNIVLNDAASTPLAGVSTELIWATDDTAAFNSFNAWVLGNTGPTDQIDLTCPSGIYNIESDFATPLQWTLNIKNLVVHWGGSTLININRVGGAIALAGKFVNDNDELGTALFHTVSAGSPSIELITHSQYNQYNADDWVLLTGLDVQDHDTQPANGFFFEWKQVSSSINTGIVTFTENLINSYNENWPYYRTSPRILNQGGPATIIKAYPEWDVTVEHNDLTVRTSTPMQFYTSGREVTFNNCNFIGPANYLTIVPTANKSITCNNCTLNYQTEVDKDISDFIVNGGTWYFKFFSSGGAQNLVIDNGALVDFEQTPIKTTLNNSTVISQISIGSGYGRTLEFNANNSLIPKIAIFTTGCVSNVDAQYTLNNGIITAPKSSPNLHGDAVFWASLGFCFFGSGTSLGMPFRILDVTGDSNNIYVHTDLPNFVGGTNGFPPFPTDPDLGLQIWDNPCPKFTAINCYGSRQAVDLSQVASRGKPLFSYSNQTFDTAYYVFTLSSPATAAEGDTYQSSGGQVFTVAISITGGTILTTTSPAPSGNDPSQSGTLSRTSGSGSDPISYSSFEPPLLAVGHGQTPSGLISVIGKIVRIVITINKNYGSALTLYPFFRNGAHVIDASFTDQIINPAVDLHQGPRTITIYQDGSVTGAVGTDDFSTISSFLPAWLRQGYCPQLSADLSGVSSSLWPSYTIEVQTDQGIIVPSPPLTTIDVLGIATSEW